MVRLLFWYFLFFYIIISEPSFLRTLISVFIISGTILLIFKLPSVTAAATKYVPASIRSNIKEISYSVMFDRIEAGTYLVAAAVTEGNLKISNIVPEIIKTEINVLKTLGSKIMVKKNEVQIIGNKKIKSTKITTAPYPGFPTDLQAQIMVLLCKANKSSIIKEDIFENRFMHVAELNRMGAKI